MENDDIFLAELAKGLSVTGAAYAAGFTRQAFYVRRHNNPDFAAAWDAAVEAGTDRLEDEALRRAKDGTLKPVFHQGKQCGEIAEYSDLLTIFLLKGRRPEKFREKHDVAVHGKLTLEQLVAASFAPDDPEE